MKTKRETLIPFFLLTFAITWGFGAFAIFLPDQFEASFGKLSDTNLLYYIAVAAPTISAISLTLVHDGWKGLKPLLARLVQWQVSIQWYVVVLAGIPIVGWLATQITGSNPLKPTNNPTQLAWMLFYIFSTGPLCEELGWRGYALPRLLKRFSPLTTSLLLGAIWGVWHLPSFFLGGMVQSGMSVPMFILFAIGLSILVTWVLMYTGGSVLMAVLIHFMVNVCASIIGVTMPTLGVMVLVAAVLVVTLDKRFGWPNPFKFTRPIPDIGAAE